MADFEKAIPIVLAHEGGARYTNIPGDSGGPTKYGITHWTLSAWRKKPVTYEDVQNLTETEAREIYRARYWDKCRCDEIEDQALATKIFDMAVNMGVMRSGEDVAELLQLAINHCELPARVDGWIGDETISFTNLCKPKRLLEELKAQQRNYYLRIIQANPIKKKFKAGWLARAEWPREKS